MAYSTLQGGVEAFLVPDVGYIGYAYEGGRAFVLGDPIAPPSESRRMIERFLREHPRAMFVQIGEATARICTDMGFFVNEFGTETDINIPDFKVSWSVRRNIQRMYNVAARSGLALRGLSAIDDMRARMEMISAEWIEEKVSSRKELRFLARPAVFSEEPDVRKVGNYVNDELIGYAFYSPMYREGKIVGYLLDIHRHIREIQTSKGKESGRGTNIAEIRERGISGAPVGITYFTIVEAVRAFQNEGLETLALGLSPLHDIRDADSAHSPFTKWLFKTIYTRLDWLYHNTGNYEFKSRWRGTEKKVYFATRERYPLKTIFHLYRLCNVF